MKSWKFWVAFTVVTISFCLVGIWAWFTSSLPQVSGEITLKGISGPITIARDKNGVPHISAATDNDLAFALGFTHAQDRLWQMNINRRIGRGELAEVLGEDALGYDKYFRTLGFRQKAEKALASISDETKQALTAYANGVNAFLETNTSALPPEFILTRSKPSQWSPTDSILWFKMMSLDLSGNMHREIARAQLLTALPPEKVMSVFPTYPGETEPPLPDLKALYAESPIKAVDLAIGKGKPEGYGSNNWVVAGWRTTSGKPLLANDPHLGLTTPSIWYLVRLHNTTTGTNQIGASFPGVPAIVLGRNDRIAWGFTNTFPDTQDLFIEKLSEDGAFYKTPDGQAPLITRQETITIKDSPAVTITVRETRHGPIVSDIFPATSLFVKPGYAIALQWTALMDEDHSIETLRDLAAAGSFQDVKNAGHTYGGPQQNIIYGDIDGNIGYYAPALVPIRRADNAIMGRLPSPGWDARYDWQGFIPYKALPTRENPKSGLIATANERIVPEDYPYFITRDWTIPYRGNRIRHLLTKTEKHDIESFKTIQADIVSDMARDILPHLLAALPKESEGYALLQNWTGKEDVSQPEPLIFNTWLMAYQKLLMADELGDLYTDFERIRPRLLKSSLYWSVPLEQRRTATDYYTLPPLEEATSLSWCDDTDTEDTQETCPELADKSMKMALADLKEKYGNKPEAWRWGDEHILHQTHRPMSQIKALKGYFELSSPVSGDRYTINVAGVNRSNDNRNQSSFGPSYRGIFDLSDLDKSRYIQPTGQSGNPFSPHYNDMFERWKAVDSFEISAKITIPEENIGILTLKPE